MWVFGTYEGRSFLWMLQDRNKGDTANSFSPLTIMGWNIFRGPQAAQGGSLLSLWVDKLPPILWGFESDTFRRKCLFSELKRGLLGSDTSDFKSSASSDWNILVICHLWFSWAEILTEVQVQIWGHITKSILLLDIILHSILLCHCFWIKDHSKVWKMWILQLPSHFLVSLLKLSIVNISLLTSILATGLSKHFFKCSEFA